MLGQSLAMGDFNGDGFDDIILGAPHASPSYTVGTGDFDCDGFSDFAISSYETSPTSGAVYVIFGKSSSREPRFDLNSLNGSNGFIIHGLQSLDSLGASPGNLEDVNGNGCRDLILASVASPRRIEASALSLRLDGEFAGDNFGVAMWNAGDLNNNDLDEIGTLAPTDSSSGHIRSGKVYVVYGRPDGPSSITTSALIGGSDGFRIDEQSPYALLLPNSAGNGDVVADLSVGTPSIVSGRRQSEELLVVAGMTELGLFKYRRSQDEPWGAQDQEMAQGEDDAQALHFEA